MSRLTDAEKFELIIECRKSGLSDRSWCLNKGISPSTFYSWLKQLRRKACYEIPESRSRMTDVAPVAEQQDVVKVNIVPEEESYLTQTPNSSFQPTMVGGAPVNIQLKDICININNCVDPLLLAHTLKILKGLSC